MGNKNKKKLKKQKDVDWAAEEHFDKGRAIIYIEHTTECPIFAYKAEEFKKYLQEHMPDRMFELVRNKYGKEEPRAGAFEINFCQNARTSMHCLWSGLERGPPRRDKFPESYDQLMPGVLEVLKKFYADPVNDGDMLDDDNAL